MADETCGMFLLRARLHARQGPLGTQSESSADTSGVSASMIGDNCQTQCDECGVIAMPARGGGAWSPSTGRGSSIREPKQTRRSTPYSVVNQTPGYCSEWWINWMYTIVVCMNVRIWGVKSVNGNPRHFAKFSRHHVQQPTVSSASQSIINSPAMAKENWYTE